MENNVMFSYGSNLNMEQMKMRCPKSSPIKQVVLMDHELVFRGNSKANGVATVEYKKGSVVYGGIWNITEKCKEALDRYEGYPWLYDIKQIDVVDENGKIYKVFTYYMVKGKIAKPSQYYLNTIIKGYDDFNIVNEYAIKNLYEKLGVQ